MAGPLATKLRLVRCPICRLVLPELPNIPVYKCGGCNTVLQAKKCKNDTMNTYLQIPDEVDQDNCSSKQNNGRMGDPNEVVQCNGKQTRGVNFSDEVASSSTELYHLDSEESSSPVAGAAAAAAPPPHSHDVNESRNYLEQDDSVRNQIQDGSVNFSDEIELNDNDTKESSPVVSKAHSDKKTCLEENAFGDFKRGDWPRNTKFFNDYGYEGSVSSSDGNEDHQVHDPYLNLLKRTKIIETKSPTVQKRDDEVMNRRRRRRIITGYSEPMEHYTTKGKWQHQDELVEPMRCGGPPIRSRMIFEPRVPLVGYETGGGGPSNYTQEEEFQYGTSIIHSSANKPEKKPEEDKMELLLKLVFELQDQLKATSISKGGVVVVPPPPPPNVEMYLKRCPHQYRTSRIPFSAEANIRRRYTQTEPHSCFHCCHRGDRQFSAPLSPHVFCDKINHYKSHQSPRYCNLYSFNPCRPPQYSTSCEFSLQSYNANSDDRERNRLKRHIRPLAGGAPFVICYLCSELLLLPLDFPQSKGRFHKLRCSACSNTLKFSLEDGTCIHPYTDDDDNNNTPDAAKAPPPSEVDDYGPSLGKKTCSTQGEPFSAGIPFQAAKMEMFAAAGPSSKMSKAEKNSPEIEELRPRSVSPLHRLMGYTSPSEVMQR